MPAREKFDLAMNNFNIKLKELKLAHVASVEAVMYESYKRGELLDAIPPLELAEKELVEDTAASAAQLVTQAAESAAQLITQTEMELSVKQGSPSLQPPEKMQIEAQETLELAQKVALELLADTKRLAHEKSTRETEVRILTSTAPSLKKRIF